MYSWLSLITHETLFPKRPHFRLFRSGALDYAQSAFLGFQCICLPRHLTHRIFRSPDRNQQLFLLWFGELYHSAAPLYANKSGLNLLNVLPSFSSRARPSGPSGKLQPATDAKSVFPIVVNCPSALLHELWSSHNSFIGLRHISDKF